jgi:transmembrane sensor
MPGCLRRTLIVKRFRSTGIAPIDQLAIHMTVNKQLLEKYLKGACTAEEAGIVEAYLTRTDTPELDELFYEAWQETEEPQQKKSAVRMFRYWYAAAAVLLLASVGGWWWRSMPAPGIAAGPAQRWDTLSNPGADVRVLQMPDGSRVWLNAYSEIYYTYEYNNSNRDLWLKGEAYFEVAPAESKPLRVHTGRLTTTALGTAFNIATGNRADGSIEVSLVQGKVLVSAKEDKGQMKYILNPGQKIAYRSGSPATGPTAFSRQEVLDWQHNQLIFEKSTLEDVFSKLQSRYGCEIRIADGQLAGRRISGQFKAGSELPEILNTLGYVHNFTFTRSDDTFIIRRRHPDTIPQETGR